MYVILINSHNEVFIIITIFYMWVTLVSGSLSNLLKVILLESSGNEIEIRPEFKDLSIRDQMI